jgi:hypothetical protein
MIEYPNRGFVPPDCLRKQLVLTRLLRSVLFGGCEPHRRWFALLTLSAASSFAQSSSAPTTLHNFAIRAEVGNRAQALTVGFVTGGTGAKTLLVRGAGPALATWGVGQPLAAPLLTLYNHAGRALISNAGWSRTEAPRALREAAQRVGAFSFRDDSLDSALLVTLPPGAYTAQVTDAESAGGVALVEIYDLDEPSASSRLINLSARCFVGAGESIAIPGVHVRGSSAPRLLIRAVGPGLARFGVRGFLARPKIEVIKPGDVIGTTFPIYLPPRTIVQNDGWARPPTVTPDGAALSPGTPEEIRAAAIAVAAFPFEEGGGDAAILITMRPDSFRLHISGADAGTGEALIEVYDVSEVFSEPNKAPEPTTTSVTPRARLSEVFARVTGARGAPAAVVAHL